MSTQIQKFVFPLTNQETRIVDLNGNPWWVLRDVCEVLSIGNPGDVSARLDDDEKAAIDLIDTRSDGSEVVRARAKITAKGLAKLASAFEAVSSN